MKLKLLLATLFVAGLVVSMAAAAPTERGKGKNKDGTTATSTTEADRGKKKGHSKQGCKPRRAVILVGDFAGAGEGSFAMLVKAGNKLGKSLAGKQVTIAVTDGTKIRRAGKATIADLVTGDLLLVQGRACKLDSQALTLEARKVVVLSASDENEDDGDESTTTTTSTTTTQTTP